MSEQRQAMALPVPGDDEVLFVALGGLGEVGMNVALYGRAGQWIMVDLGITFGDDTTPGVDIILPDLACLEGQENRLAAIVLTHAHEDHVGAVPYVWQKVRCPIYATPFTAEFVRRKLTEEGVAGEAKVKEVPRGGRFMAGPFDIELIPVAHSIPEAHGVAIRSDAGTLFHTGDWKLDPDPVIGPPTDEAAFRRLGDEGVLAMICDSTNAIIEGHSRSEAELLPSITDLISARTSGRVVFTCFASNVARLQTISRAAAANGRRVALVGRSLRRMDQVARSTGYLRGVPDFLSEEHVGFLPPDEVVLICTGSQGEPRAALHRIAGGTHPHVVLDPDDTIVFSSRTIPGNERAVDRLQNQLARMGMEIITNRDHFVHVSGHPARGELRRMYEWIRPKVSVPVHGEIRHRMAHRELVQKLGTVPHSLLPENGSIIRFTRSESAIVGEVHTGRLTFDGQKVVPLEGGALRARRRMVENGVATISLVLDAKGKVLTEPQISVHGLVHEEEEGDMAALLLRAVEEAVGRLSPAARREDEPVIDAARIAVRRQLRSRYKKRPAIEVHLARV